MFRNPVLKPGFPSLFQHGEPVDLLVYFGFGPIYADPVWSGSGGINPAQVFLCGLPRQDCVPKGYSSSSSPWWAIRTLPGPCGLSDSGSYRWYSAACRRGACSAATTANYGGPPPTYTFPKIWGHLLGIHSSSSGAQDSYALTSIVLRASSSTLDLVRTGPGRTSATGP